jgi:hypothetical protein
VLDASQNVHTPSSWYLAAAGALGAVALLVAAVLAVGLLAAQAGMGTVVWPALIGVGAVVTFGALLQLERRRRSLAHLTNSGEPGAEPTDLDLIHLFAGRFAPSATGHDGFRPPLARAAVRADEAAWRAIGATLLDLAERDVLEIEPYTLPTPGDPVRVLAVRLVRPLPSDDAFASRLLHPLARRGVGASTTVGELVGHIIMANRHPASALLNSARAHLTALGFYRPAGSQTKGARRGVLAVPLGWLRAALFRPLEADPEQLAATQPAVEALEERLAAWDVRDPDLVAALRGEVLAAFLRARARASHGLA